MGGVDLGAQQIMQRDQTEELSVHVIADHRHAGRGLDEQDLELPDALARFAPDDRGQFGRALFGQCFGQLGARGDAGQFAVLDGGKTGKRAGAEGFLELAGLKTVEDDRLEIRNGRDRQLLPS